MIPYTLYRLYHAFLNEQFLSFLMQGLLICTAAMSLIAAAALMLSRRLKDRQSAAGRCLLWWIIGIGYFIPFKPHPAGTVWTVVENEPIAAQQSFFSADLFTVLFWIWLVGAVIYATVTLNQQEQFSRGIARLRKPADHTARTLARMLCEELGIRQKVRVYTVPAIDTPMLTGLLNPCILLPEQDYEAPELRLVLKHELCHLRRGDLLCKLLWIGCRAVHWFNPLIPVLIRQMERDCELACDEAVMKGENADAANTYCKSILHTAMRRSAAAHSDMLVATSFSGSKEMLKARMQEILSGGKKRRFLLTAAAVLLLTGMTGSFLAYAAMDTPEQEEETVHTVYVTTETNPVIMTTQLYRPESDTSYTEATQGIAVVTDAPPPPEYGQAPSGAQDVPPEIYAGMIQTELQTVDIGIGT